MSSFCKKMLVACLLVTASLGSDYLFSMNQQPEQSECTICLGEYPYGQDYGHGPNRDEDNELLRPAENRRRFKCVHVFHKECIEKWLKENNTCPTCKSLKNPNALRQIAALGTVGTIACVGKSTIMLTSFSIQTHFDTYSPKWLVYGGIGILIALLLTGTRIACEAAEKTIDGEEKNAIRTKLKTAHHMGSAIGIFLGCIGILIAHYFPNKK